MSFFDKLENAIAVNESLLVVALDPNPEMLPFSGENEDNYPLILYHLREWLKKIIQATSDLVCAYKPTLGFYQAFGSQGMELLLEILAAIPESIPIILDAKHGDLNSSSLFAKTIFEQWKVDAITLNPYAGQDQIAPFLVYPDKGVFILCHTSNPGAINLQEFPTTENPFYLQVVRESQTWGSPEQLFLEVGTTEAKVIQKIRTFAPSRIILVRSIWAKGGNLSEILTEGLSQNGDGLLITVPQDILTQKNINQSVNALKTEINQIRESLTQQNSRCELWTPNVCLLTQYPHQNLILQLYDIGCFLFGEYVQASGATFSYYIDLRPIISNPQVFQKVLHAYGEILKNLTFDRLAGIPYGSLPTATGLSLLLDSPMIYPRKEVKAHGTRRVIEGNFHPGEKVVIVDDILISGKSAIEGAEKLKSAGLQVEDIVVFIDHEAGVKDKLKTQGYNPYSVLTLSEITETLYEAGKIDEQKYLSLTQKH